MKTFITVPDASRRGVAIARPRGFALIATLALVVLLTFIMVLFFTRATSNRQIESAETANQEADLLARGAMQAVVRDIRQEMVAGSTNYVSSGVSIFQPITNTAAIPYRALAPGISLTDTNFYNLAKQSGTNAMFPSTAPYTNNSVTPLVIGSSITTDTVSANGRTVSGVRWNAPYLTANGFSSSSQLPTWVLLTRAGIAPSQTWNSQFGNSAQSNPNYVVGRFAYNVYDESGLLDINAAGYPSTLSQSQVASIKNSLMGTALGQIPGVLNSDALIQWRNAASAASATSYTNAAAEEATNGFLTPLPGDNQYLSRQDLINYAQANPTVLSTNALQYLTTFTRELNAPSWGPDRDATNMGSANNAVTAFNNYPWSPNGNGATLNGQPNPTFNYAYADNANTYRQWNRFIPNIRFAQSATVTNYATSGASYTYNVNTGDPLVQRRFSLDKLSWITANGPGKTSTGATPSAAAIQACFGLAWDSTHNVWDYVGPNGTTIQNWIENLDDVGDVTGGWSNSGVQMVDMTPRPPNFFELLKGGILSGSLGLYANNNTNLGGSNYKTSYTPDFQVLQIGANLIDQCSPAGTPPICIIFGYSTSYNTAINGPIYGSKSLPLINKLIFSVERPKNQNDEANFWVEFEMWNPYADAKVATLPSSFRIVFGGDGTGTDITMPVLPGGGSVTTGGNVLGAVIAYLTYPSGVPTWNWEAAVPWLGPGATSNSNGHAITVSNFADTMDEPIMLDQVRRDGATVTSGSGPGSGLGPDPSVANDVYTGTTSLAYSPPATLTESPPPTATGFWLGERYLDSVDQVPPIQPGNFALWSPAAGTGGTGTANLNGSYCDAGFYLQYYYGTTLKWRTVQVIHELNVNAGYACGPAPNSNVFTDIRYKQLGFGFADPRSDRFGMQGYSVGNSLNGDNSEIAQWTVSPNNAASLTSQYWGNSIFGNPTDPTTQWYTGGTLGNNNLFQPWNGGQVNPGEAFRYADNSAAVASGGPLLYQDLDGVQRPGDGVWNSGSPSQGVYPLATAFPSVRTGANGYATDRPVMLNRPFQSVGEMAYAFRGTPWRSLDLSSPNSADTALMDFFCVGDDSQSMHAGRINPNRASPVTLAALIEGANQDVLNGTYLSTANAPPVASAISAALQSVPAMSKAQLLENLTSGTLSNDVSPIKSQKEGVVRAIADVSQVRTWNLLVDIVAQAGRFSPLATSGDQFTVQGERRYWLHLAIDRYTGQVVDQQLEPVNE